MCAMETPSNEGGPGRRQGLGPRPAEAMIKDVSRGAGDETHGDPERQAEPALHETPEERLFDRTVEHIERGLKPRVAATRRDAEDAATAREQQLYRGGGDEQDRLGGGRKDDLRGRSAGGKAEPCRPPADLDYRDDDREGKEPSEQIRRHPAPAVGKTRERDSRCSRHGVRGLLRLHMPVRLSRLIAARGRGR